MTDVKNDAHTNTCETPEHAFRLVILDCDGVLIDSEPLAAEATAFAARAAGVPLSAEDARKLFTGKDHAYIADWLLRHGVKDPDAVFRTEAAELNRLIETSLKPVPGVIETLDALTALGIPWCIASNSGHARLKRTLGRVGILPLAEGRIYSADDVARGKPDPDLHLLCAKTFGIAPSDVLVIDDSVTGIEGARAAGMSALGFTGLAPADSEEGSAKALLKAGAFGILLKLNALPELFDFISSNAPYQAPQSEPSQGLKTSTKSAYSIEERTP